jgi:signal transduction histidine kinase
MRQDDAVANDLTRRFRLLWWAVTAIPLSATSLVLFILTAVGTCLIAVWVGIPVLVVTIGLTRGLARHRRRRIEAMTGNPLESPYLKQPTGGPIARVGGLAVDPAVRRDMLWLFLDGTVGLALSIIAVGEGVLDLLFWWLPVGIAARAHARIDRALLAPTEKTRLAQRVEQLTESRAETVDTQAAELRRIERDLHDGAQARLVAIGMSLGLAEEQLDRDPDLAKSLLLEARDTASDALAELRDLVRGIHPPVLADRGFVEAVRALASAMPVQAEVRADLPDRLPAPLESAAYFAVAEGLANVVKHAAAKHVVIALTRTNDDVELIVEDDGIGGADPARGTGLHGIARRLSAFDGVLRVDSPPGGPTKVVMVLPCASSSAKISPSSEKA